MSRSIWKGPYIDQSIWKKYLLKTLPGVNKTIIPSLGSPSEVNAFGVSASGGRSNGATAPSLQSLDCSIEGKKKVTSISDNKNKIAAPRVSTYRRIWNRQSMITPELIGIKCEVHAGNKWVNLNISEDRIGHLFGEFAATKKIAQYKRKAKAKKKGK